MAVLKIRPNQKRIILAVFLLLLVSPPSSFSSAKQPSSSETKEVKQPKPLKTNLILVAVPIRVRTILAGGTVDALEKLPEEMPPIWDAVLFRIEKVLMGDFERIHFEEPRLMDQMKEAVHERNILKLLTMDFEKTDEEGVPKEFFTMAVLDPYVSFGIKEGEEPSRDRYKLYLALVHKEPNSYVLVKSEKIGPSKK